MRLILICLVLTFSWSHAFAVSENTLKTTLDDVILPFYTSQLQSGIFQGKDDVAISYVKLEVPDEKGALVISSGRTESHIKYAEFIYDLRDAGFSIYILDHRGQGFSGRMLDDPQKGYIGSFEDYVADLKTFVDTVVNARGHATRFILAHSMGGTIAVMYVAKYPDDFDGLILSAPMLQINTSPLPETVAALLTKVLIALGMGDSYIPGGNKYDPDEPFEDNEVTHSQVRYAMNKKFISLNSQIALGSPTNRWLREGLKAARQATESTDRIELPVLLLQAEMDSVVKPDAQDEFCRKAKGCTKVTQSGARHEILMERDEVRDKALDHILDFLNKHATTN